MKKTLRSFADLVVVIVIAVVVAVIIFIVIHSILRSVVASLLQLRNTLQVCYVIIYPKSQYLFCYTHSVYTIA